MKHSNQHFHTYSFSKAQVFYARFLLMIMVLQIFPFNYLVANPFRNISIIKNINVPILIDQCNEISTSKNAIHNQIEISKTISKGKNIQNRVILAAPKVVAGGGPSMPEVQGFTAASNQNMVDPFTGDFSFNIPLLDVGGFPINIAYKSGVSANDEASWVGLGWNLNLGSVSRQMRGLPDDFKGEEIVRNTHMKKKEVMSIGIGSDIQFAGVQALKGLGLSNELEIEFDNYEGWALKAGIGGSYKIQGEGLSGSLGITAGIDSRSGGYVNPSIGMSGSFKNGHNKSTFGASIGMNIDSREGLKQINFGTSFSNRMKQEKENTGKFNASSIFPLSFASPSYSPSINLPVNNTAVSFHGTIGGEVSVVHINADVSGSYSSQEVVPIQETPAYGYMYSQFATDASMMDVNREKDGPYQKELPNMPVTVFAHDIFSASGEGISGTFRPMRGDIGTLHDPLVQNTNASISGGGELGFGQLVHAGMDISIGNGSDVSGKWKEENQMNAAFQFIDSSLTSDQYEPVYFKNIGEMTTMANPDLFTNLGGFDLVKVELQENDILSTANATNRLSNGSEFTNIGQTLKQNREIRNKMFSWKTIKEQRQRGSSFANWSYKDIHGVTINESLLSLNETSLKKPHHIAEISIAEPTGKKYIYGIPAYNLIEKEVSFNVGEESAEDANGNVAYDNIANGIGNRNGLNHYFSSTTTPAYAYAWLLTNVLSEDYQDVTNDGVSADDLGSYTKISYKKSQNNYKWRTTTASMQAKFQEGNTSTKEDNKASYVYGEKEIFYVDQVETRNYIALFYTSPRQDALGVNNENGGINRTNELQKLDSIKLYTKAGFIELNKVPVSAVFFEYDYSLALNQPNSIDNGGKLSLKKLWIEQGESSKGKENPYLFYYRNNPNYHPQHVDRWGNYKRQLPTLPPNDDYPYTVQDKLVQDSFSYAWHLDSIFMPNGSAYSIKYESDDYAYVQDKRAMVMCPILGFANSSTAAASALSNILYTGSNSNQFLFFKLPNSGYVSDQNAYLQSFFDGIENLLYQVNIKLTNEPDGFEKLSGFIPSTYLFNAIESGRAGYSIDPSIAWIQLPYINKETHFNVNQEYDYTFRRPTQQIHPISQAGFELIRSEFPQTIHDSYDHGSMGNFLSALDQFAAAASNVLSGGEENYLLNTSRCDRIKIEGSYLRLNQPLGKKLGGGNRVKEIRLHDHWGKMQTTREEPNLNFQYGSVYIYNLEDGKSSGVAAYEPMIGNDENPLAQPLPYRIVKTMASDLNKFQMEPLGEMYYPAPIVGYSKIIQTSLPRPIDPLHPERKANSTGSVVSEFYTAKDFPVITKRTPIQRLAREVTIPLQFYNHRLNSAAVSQGFYIELNDMHGKLKRNKTIDANGNEISGTEYEYKRNEFSLDNNVPVVDSKTGILTNQLIGVDYDFVMDARNFKSIQDANAVQVNIELFMIGPIPVPIPIPLPSITRNLSEYRGMSVTKVIFRSAILQTVRTYMNGASLATNNLVYDGLTGQVIVNETENEFHSSNYSTTIPAYWAYPEMGHASKNEHYIGQHVRLIDGNWNNIPESLLVQGDELLLYDSEFPETPSRAWVYRIIGNSAQLINAAGLTTIPSRNYTIMIVKSGYKNNLASTLGTIVSQDNPITEVSPTTLRLNLNPDKVLQSSVQTYSDFWQTEVGLHVNERKGTCTCAIDPKTEAKITEILNIIKKGILNRDSIPEGWSFFDAYVRIPFQKIVNKINLGPCEIIVSTADGLPFNMNGQTNFSTTSTFGQQNCEAPTFVSRMLGKQRINFYTDCFDLINCVQGPDIVAVSCGAGVLNPFLNGILGRYKPLASYQPIAKRTQTGHIESSGFLETYIPFARWEDQKLKLLIGSEYWQRLDSVTTVDSRGNNLEILNALDIPSSTYFGFSNVLPIAVAQNAKYNCIAYDGFEDYFYQTTPRAIRIGECVLPSHFHGTSISSPQPLDQLDNTKSHSGLYSVKLEPRLNWQYTFSLVPASGTRGTKEGRTGNRTFEVNRNDFTKIFEPQVGKYVVSAWVHMEDLTLSNFSACSLRIGPHNFSPSGPIIDGWQQINGIFDIINTDREINIEASVNGVLGTRAWLDDLRIFPYSSTLETYAFDPIRLRMMAKHNSQNYTQFFEYNADGSLTRNKQETEQGIYTITETKSGLPIFNH